MNNVTPRAGDSDDTGLDHNVVDPNIPEFDEELDFNDDEDFADDLDDDYYEDDEDNAPARGYN